MSDVTFGAAADEPAPPFGTAADQPAPPSGTASDHPAPAFGTAADQPPNGTVVQPLATPQLLGPLGPTRGPGNLSSTYLLSRSSLNDEQKLQVALCRRQCWLRAFQLGPIAALCGYAGCILLDGTPSLLRLLRLTRLPRGSRLGVPLGAGIVGLTLGAYLGGREGKGVMNQVLRAKGL